MSTTATVSVDLRAKGLKELADNSSQVAENFKNAEKSIAKMGAAAKQSAAPKGALAQGVDSSRDSSISRGIGGQTGAEGRDFAKQAQGLGGLVHVYATFAANVFALSAAFTALSKAADTTNLVKGLDQLGAQSGRALGSLAKQMVNISDGALSMQDALRSSALASSGGLTDSAIKRMTAVALKASQALGRDMPDSLDRLTKGIVKNQPELLDELGIMTRMIPAQQAYARSIGKSVEQLSTFEKSLAFQNAVLEEGERKFKAISLAANPYSKISAGLSNLLQTGLEVVNFVLSPIVSLLGSSPAALAGAMGLLGVTLLKQAIPALGMMKDSMAEAAENAKKIAVAKSAEAGKGYAAEYVAKANALHEQAQLAKRAAIKEASEQSMIKIAAADDAADRAVESVVSAEKRIADIKENIRKKSNAGAILSKDIDAITPADIKSLESKAKEYDSKAAKGLKGYAEAAIAHKEAIASIQEVQKAHAAFEEVYATQTKVRDEEHLKITNAIADAEKAHTAGTAEREAQATLFAARQLRQSKDLTNAKMTQVAADRAVLSSISKGITAQAAQTASISGFSAAWREAKEATTKAMQSAEKGDLAMGKWQARWTDTKSAVVGATAVLGNFLNFMGPWVAGISIVVGLLEAMYVGFSNSRDANDRFTSSVASMSDTAKVAGETLAAISVKGLGENFTVESLQARANAMASVADAVKVAAANFKDLEKTKNAVEKGVDALYWIFGKSDIELLTKGVAKDIDAAQRLITDPKVAQTFQTAINTAFGKPVAINEVGKALKSLSDNDALSVIDKLVPVIQKASDTANSAASRLTTFKDSLKSLGDQVAEYTHKLIPSDDFSKFGVTLFKIYSNISDASLNAASSIEALNDAIAKDPNIGIFAKGAVLQLQKANLELKELERRKKEVDSFTDKNTKVRDEPVTLHEVFSAAKKEDIGARHIQAAQLIKESSKESFRLSELMYSRQADAAKLSVNFMSELAAETEKYFKFAKSAAELNSRIAIRKAAISIDSSYGASTSNEEKSIAKLERDQRNKEIELQFDMYNSQRDNTNAILDLTDAFKVYTTADKTVKDNIENSTKERHLKQAELAKKDPIDQAKAIKKLESNTIFTTDIMKAEDHAQKERFSKTMLTLDLETRKLGILKQQLDLVQLYGVKYSAQLADSITDTEVKSVSSKYDKEELELRNKLDHLKGKGYASDIASLRNQLSVVESAREQEILTLRVTKAYEKYKNLSSEAAKIEEMRLESYRVINTLYDNEAKSTQNGLDIARQLGSLTEAELITATAKLETEKLLRDTFLEQAKAKSDLLNKTNEIEDKRAAAELAKGGGTYRVPLSLDDDKQYNDSILNLQTMAALQAGISTSNVVQQTIDIANKTRINSLLAENNKHLNEAQSITESLTSIFGEMGNNLGKIGESLVSAANSMSLMAERKKQLIEDKVDVNSDKYKKYESDKTKLELTNISTIAGATKKLFKEKSTGYKVLEGIEKASSAVRLGIQLEETALKISSWVAETTAKAGAEAANTSLTFSGVMARMGAYAAQIYASTIGQLGPIAGPAVASGLVAGILAMLGGSSGPGFSVPSVEDQQKASGTGQSYNSEGQLVSNGGGALGDSSAKNTSIVDGIERLSKINFDMLDFAKNETLDALKAIKTNTENFVKVTSTSLSPTGGASAFGTKEGTDKSGYQGLGGIFGNSESTTIDNVGTIISGSLKQLVGGAGLRQTFEDVTVSWSKGFWDSGTDPKRLTKDLTGSVSDYVTGIFSAFKTTLVSVADSMGTTKASVEKILDSQHIDINVSGKGLTGKEYAEAIMSAIGIQMDLAAKQAFPALEALEVKFQNFGESNTDFILRLFDTTKNIKLAFDSIGKSTDYLNGSLGNNLALSLATAAGSLDEFISLNNKFSDDFLTDAEKLAPVTTAVAKQLVNLGLASVDTRDEFKQTILSWSDWSEAGTKTYVELLKLAPAFDKVTESTKSAVKVLSETEINSARDSQYSSILKLLGRSEDELRFTRAKELEGMDERLRSTQTYIYYLEDLNKAQEKFNTNIKSLGDTLFGLENQLITAQGAASGGTGANAAKALIVSRTRTKDLANLTDGLSDTQKTAITTAYDYNLALTSQIDAQNAANAANTAATSANEALAKSQDDSAKSAASAAQTIKDAWQSISDSLFEEINRIRGILDPTLSNLNVLQEKFRKASLAAKTGDSEAAKTLPKLSQDILAMTEQTATSALDLKRAQATVAANLEDVGTSINSQYGLFGPDDTLARSQDALRRATESATASADAAASAAQATADAANASALAANTALALATTASEDAKKKAEDAYAIAKEKGETTLTLAEWIASQQFSIENKAYSDSLVAKTTYFTTMLGLETAYYTASSSALANAIAAAATTVKTVSTSTVAANDATVTSPVSNTDSYRYVGDNSTGSTYSLSNSKYYIPSYDVGTNSVPEDMLAMVHKGEKITPAPFNNDDLLNELRALRAEVAQMRESQEGSSIYIKRTSDTLNRVSLGGNSFYTTAA